jgi:DNA replication protein DnaC
VSGADRGDAVAPATRPGLLTEGGEPMKGPFEAQTIEIPVRDRIARTARRLGFQSLGDAAARYQASAGGPGSAETGRERLLYLFRWVGATENSREMVERCRARIADLNDGGKAVGRALRDELAVWEGRLAEATERDEIQASRPAHCWCLGLGGREQIGVVVRDPDEPDLVLFSEADPPLTWSVFCSCPEGAEAKLLARFERNAMRARGMARRHRKLLGAARIPIEYQAFDLDTYPDAAIAERVTRWYRTNLAQVDVAAENRTVKPFILLSGPNRRGKTGLAIGVVKLALEREIQAVFRTVPDLLDELRSTYDEGNPACHADLLAALKEVPLLVLDDIGAQQMTKWVAETMFSLLDYRGIHHKITVLTTNLGWKNERAYDKTELANGLGDRIFWRVRAPSHVVFVNGPILGMDATLTRRKPPTADDEIDIWD